MAWVQVLAIVLSNVILAAVFIGWSRKEGRVFRKKLRENSR